jgi:glycylpeptide N-tetradecanoyltransferase
MKLEKDFHIENLSIFHLDKIQIFLDKNYIEDCNGIFRIIYSKDYLYWYLKDSIILGMMYLGHLIGMISAKKMRLVVEDQEEDYYYINFLCVSRNFRKRDISKILITEMKNKLDNFIFRSFCNVSCNCFCISNQYQIPLNCEKLKKIGFLNEDFSLPNKNQYLHLLKEHDIPELIKKLNTKLKNYKIRPFIDHDSVSNYLFPKKNIVYSFVIRNNNNITDFVSVYKYYQYCFESKKVLSVAYLGYYFYTSVSLTELIEMLLIKLVVYNFDQFIFNDIAENKDINITKYSSSERIFYHSSSHIKIDNRFVFLYPF